MSAGCDDCCGAPASGEIDKPFRRALWIALVLNGAMFAVELYSSFLGRSVALQADAMDFLADAANYSISLFVLGMSLRAKAMAAFIKAGTMGLFGIWVLGMALYRVLEGGAPEPFIMGPVALLALAVNVGVALLLFAHREGDANRQSIWLCSRNDAIANLAVFAAAAGGADSISVLPHTLTHGLPDGFARRVARNTQLVLAQEAGIGFVADPSAGSGGIAHLTEALCEAAWAEFQQIEQEGGALKSLAAGAFQARVKTVAAERRAALRAGRRTIVGTTLYPLDTERPVATLAAESRPAPTEGTTFCERLSPQRLDEQVGEDA
jgi:hypothetical protein